MKNKENKKHKYNDDRNVAIFLLRGQHLSTRLKESQT